MNRANFYRVSPRPHPAAVTECAKLYRMIAVFRDIFSTKCDTSFHIYEETAIRTRARVLLCTVACGERREVKLKPVPLRWKFDEMEDDSNASLWDKLCYFHRWKGCFTRMCFNWLVWSRMVLERIVSYGTRCINITRMESYGKLLLLTNRGYRLNYCQCWNNTSNCNSHQ